MNSIIAAYTVYAVSTPDTLICKHSGTLYRSVFLQMLLLILLDDVWVPFSMEACIKSIDLLTGYRNL